MDSLDPLSSPAHRRRASRLVGFSAAALLVLLLSVRLDAQNRTYSWKDANGVVHFSNSAPPVGAKVTESASGGEFRPVPLESDAARSRKLVQVELKGSRETAQVRMIVDTGAQKTMIDRELAEQIGVLWMREELVGGVTGVGRGARVEIPALRIGSAELRDVDVIVGPARGLLLLGMDVLDQLDLSVGRDSLYRSSR